MKHVACFFFGLCLLPPYAQLAAAADPSYREPHPHWTTFSTPFDEKFFDVRIDVPAGYSLCGVDDTYSRWQEYYVPLDQKQRCEDWSVEDGWEKMGDVIVIAPFMDTSTYMDTLKEYIAKDSRFCSAVRKAAGDGFIDPKTASKVPASVKSAGRSVMGLSAAVCVREDTPNDLYSKAYLAYQPVPNGIGYGVTVGSYVRLKSKPEADRLLEQIANLLQVLPFSRGN